MIAATRHPMAVGVTFDAAAVAAASSDALSTSAVISDSTSKISAKISAVISVLSQASEAQDTWMAS
jgi:hypothetical protein